MKLPRKAPKPFAQPKGKHAAKDNLCTFTWVSKHPDKGSGYYFLDHACGNQITDRARRQCSSKHVCRDWNCEFPQYDTKTAQ